MRLDQRKDVGLGSSLAVSLLLHGALLALVVFFGTFRTFTANQAPVYYVDLLNLPVADPRSGSPVSVGNDREQAPAPAISEPLPAPPQQPPKLTAPARTPDPTVPKKTRTAEEKALQERLARLQNNVEGRHAAAAIASLRQKTAAGTGRQGMPGATGSKAGSDYASYIQSRLRDAFMQTIAARTPNPQVVVRLTIDRSGKVIGYRLERSSGDTVFENSVLRAVTRAEESFPPPPGGTVFQQGFIFKPEGVATK